MVKFRIANIQIIFENVNYYLLPLNLLEKIALPCRSLMHSCGKQNLNECTCERKLLEPVNLISKSENND